MENTSSKKIYSGTCHMYNIVYCIGCISEKG